MAVLVNALQPFDKVKKVCIISSVFLSVLVAYRRKRKCAVCELYNKNVNSHIFFRLQSNFSSGLIIQGKLYAIF